MSVSGQESKGKATERREAPSTPAQPEFQVPEGMVLLDKATHDAQGGELRRVKRELQQRKDADEDRERQEREKAAREAGDFERLSEIEVEKRQALEARVRRAELGEALRDEIAGRGYSGEKAAAIKRLVDPNTVQYDNEGVPIGASVMAAVDRVVATYPNMFGEAAEVERMAQPAQPRTPARGPSTPPAEAPKLPSDFLSQEEYSNTPWEIRRTPEFQERAKRSEHFWPKVVHRSTFQQAPE